MGFVRSDHSKEWIYTTYWRIEYGGQTRPVTMAQLFSSKGKARAQERTSRKKTGNRGRIEVVTVATFQGETRFLVGMDFKAARRHLEGR